MGNRVMMSKKLNDERLYSIAREVEAGAKLQEACGRHQVSQAAFCAGLMSSLEQPLTVTARKAAPRTAGNFMASLLWPARQSLN